uniref:Myeloid-associated differentiation marker homolog n=1 Tax=Astyanax mexicanus TaxID=7994 RepID=W5LSK1_ASTMX
MTRLYWMRLLALVFSCVTFGLVAHAGGLGGGVGAWCMFCWTFSFIGTLLIFLVEIFDLTENVKDFWVNFSVTFSSYAALLCLFASITFSHSFLKDHHNYDVLNHLIAAAFFSWMTTLAYLLEVWMARSESKCYMASTLGHLLVCQTFVAGVNFYFISNPVSYTDMAGVRWCMAVYCICFICSFGIIINIMLCGLEQLRWQKYFYLSATVMYFSALITWPVFKFNNLYPSPIYPPESCQKGLGLCPRGMLVMVTVLTALNFLLYSISLYCSYCLDSLTEEQEYTEVLETSLVQDLYPAQQHSSNPRMHLLGYPAGHLRSYQSMNQPNLLVCGTNVIVCHTGYVSQTHGTENRLRIE